MAPRLHVPRKASAPNSKFSFAVAMVRVVRLSDSKGIVPNHESNAGIIGGFYAEIRYTIWFVRIVAWLAFSSVYAFIIYLLIHVPSVSWMRSSIQMPICLAFRPMLTKDKALCSPPLKATIDPLAMLPTGNAFC